MGGQEAQNMALNDPDDEQEEPQLSVLTAILTLCIATAFVGVCAEFMVSTYRAVLSLFSEVIYRRRMILMSSDLGRFN